jgi:hypothetical protein
VQSDVVCERSVAPLLRSPPAPAAALPCPIELRTPSTGVHYPHRCRPIGSYRSAPFFPVRCLRCIPPHPRCSLLGPAALTERPTSEKKRARRDSVAAGPSQRQNNPSKRHRNVHYRTNYCVCVFAPASLYCSPVWLGIRDGLLAAAVPLCCFTPVRAPCTLHSAHAQKLREGMLCFARRPWGALRAVNRASAAGRRFPASCGCNAANQAAAAAAAAGRQQRNTATEPSGMHWRTRKTPCRWSLSLDRCLIRRCRSSVRLCSPCACCWVLALCCLLAARLHYRNIQSPFHHAPEDCR